MSNKYVFLASTLSNIGGAQLYINNKMKFLNYNNWDVHVFQLRNGSEILINEFRNQNHNIIEYLRFPPSYFTVKQQKKTINQIIEQVSASKFDKVVIESHNIVTAQWGELVAKKLGGKNFVYLLSESFNNINKDILDFLYFKYNRRELAGTSKESLELLFSDYKIIPENEKYYLKAVSSEDIFHDISSPLIEKIDRMDINICCISRLEKPFVKIMIDEIALFASKFKNKKIQLIMIGDSPNEKDKVYIINKMNQHENIKLVITGRLYPIPKSLFSKIDLFIGVAGAIMASANEGELSLSVDVDTYVPIGILGYDTNNARYGKSDKYNTISEALESILIDNKLQEKTESINFNINKVDYMDEFNKHMDFIFNSERKLIYNTEKLLNYNYTLKERVKKTFIRFLGINKYDKLVKKIR